MKQKIKLFEERQQRPRNHCKQKEDKRE